MVFKQRFGLVHSIRMHRACIQEQQLTFSSYENQNTDTYLCDIAKGGIQMGPGFIDKIIMK